MKGSKEGVEEVKKWRRGEERLGLEEGEQGEHRVERVGNRPQYRQFPILAQG